MEKPNVLWLGLEQFSFPLNETADEKYKILNQHFNSYVLSCNNERKLKKIIVNDAHFHLMPLYGKLVYSFPLYISIMFFMLPRLVFKNKINVIVAADPFIPGSIAAFWKRVLFWKKLGLVVEAFGNWTETPAAPLPKPLRWPVRTIIKMASYWSISAADALRAESMVTLKKLQSYTKKNLPSDQFNLMHMELFDKEDVKVARKDKDFRMLFIGRVVKLKGVQFVIDILGQIKDRHPEAKLLIGGDGEYMEELRKQAEKLNVTDKVIFLGNLGRRQVKEQLANCDLFILPSMSEGRPRVLIEAMAMSKFMIASNVGAIHEIVEDGKNGFLINPYNIEQIKERIVYCLENKERIKRMGEKENKILLKNFGDRFTIAGWGRLYTSLIKQVYQSKFSG